MKFAIIHIHYRFANYIMLISFNLIIQNKKLAAIRSIQQ